MIEGKISTPIFANKESDLNNYKMSKKCQETTNLINNELIFTNNLFDKMIEVYPNQNSSLYNNLNTATASPCNIDVKEIQ